MRVIEAVRMRRICLAFMVVVFTGCGSNQQVPIATKGKVQTKNGVACASALVVFHPIEKERLNHAKPVATTDAQGRFVLTTNAADDGAMPGEYGVTIVWPGKPSSGQSSGLSLSSESGGAATQDQLGGKYGNPQSPLLKVKITDKSNEELLLEVDPPRR